MQWRYRMAGSKRVSLLREEGPPLGWAIECIEPDNDGRCHKAVFWGPDAYRQARQFARLEYGVDLSDRDSDSGNTSVGA